MFNNNLTPFLLLAVTAGLFYTYLNPGYVRIQELRAEQIEYQDALGRVDEIQQIRADLLDRFNSISDDDMERLERLVPDSVDHVKLLLDLDGVAEKYGIELGNVRTSRPQEGVQSLDASQEVKPYENIEVSLSFVSTYENFARFIKETEESLQLIDVTGVSLRDTEDDGVYEYTVNFKTYWLKQ